MRSAKTDRIMTDRKPVTSIIWTEEIDKVRQEREDILTRCFTPEERRELSRRHVRSTAGTLALKRAISALIQRRSAVGLVERDIVIARTEQGRPFLDDKSSTVFSAMTTQHLFLSISHSRSRAYGLVVYQEPNDG